MIPANFEANVLEHFEKDFRAHWAEYCRMESKPPGTNSKEAAQRADLLYTRTKSSELPFVILGPGGIRNDEELVSNFKLLSCEGSKKKTNEAATGAILSGQWSHLINDIFLLAVINSNKEAHIVTSKHGTLEEASLWDKEKGRFSHFGREIAMLLAAGYKRVAAPPKMGMVFHCSRPAGPSPITLQGLRQETQKIKSLPQLKALLAEAEHCPSSSEVRESLVQSKQLGSTVTK